MTRLALVLAVALAAAGAGCSGSRPTGASSTGAVATTGTQAAAAGGAAATTGPGALQAEANAAATGDIPDNQVFLRFSNASEGYSLKYPEGWAQQGSRARVTFRDKNNIVRVVVLTGAPPTPAKIRGELSALKGTRLQRGPNRLMVAGGAAFKVVYTTESAPNQVTGKRVTLVVDRYYLSHAGKEAIVELGTPLGVDNVDAYRLMIESFRWR